MKTRTFEDPLLKETARTPVRLAVAVATLKTIAHGLWSLLIDEDTKRVDVVQLVIAFGLALVAYGAALVYHPAGFIVAGLGILWVTLPPRAPFVHRAKGGSS